MLNEYSFVAGGVLCSVSILSDVFVCVCKYGVTCSGCTSSARLPRVTSSEVVTVTINMVTTVGRVFWGTLQEVGWCVRVCQSGCVYEGVCVSVHARVSWCVYRCGVGGVGECGWGMWGGGVWGVWVGDGG